MMVNPLAEATKSVSLAVANLPSPDALDARDVARALAAIEELRAKIEPPLVTLQNLACIKPQALMVVAIALKIGVFECFADARKYVTLADMTEKCECERELLARIVRALCSHNVLTETAPSEYSPRGVGMMLSKDNRAAGVIRHFYDTMRIMSRMNDYFDTYGLKSAPHNPHEAPIQFAFDTDKLFFEFLENDPPRQAAYNATMAAAGGFVALNWFETFPIEQRLAGVSSDRIAIVDVGGNTGANLARLLARYPTSLAQKRLVSLDLPKVVEAATRNNASSKPTGIELIGGDMFGSDDLGGGLRAVYGAKSFFLRLVLHDWPDEYARKILCNVRAAMHDDSLLLINETVMAERDPSPFAVAVDLAMMMHHASKERTEAQWTQLLESAGFRVVEIWKGDMGYDGSNVVLEAVKK